MKMRRVVIRPPVLRYAIAPLRRLSAAHFFARNLIGNDRSHINLQLGDCQMEKEVVVAIVGATTTLVVAIGGWTFAWMMQRDTQTRDRLRKRVAQLTDDVRARIEVEKEATALIAELSNKTQQAAMLEVRKRTEEKTGLRPRLSPSQLVFED